MKLFKRPYIFLLGIVVVSFVLRFVQLGSIPVGLHGDEASIGYSSYALLKTGRDQNGVYLPLSIDQFGDHRPPGYHYVDIPFIKIFGLNEFAVRLPSVLFGVASSVILYVLVLKILGSVPIALLAALFLAISPWHVNISRATSEGVIAAFFVLCGVFLFIKAIEVKKTYVYFFVSSFIAFFLSFLFYHSARFFVPLFLIPTAIVLFLQYRPEKKKLFYSVVLFVCLILSLLVLFSVGKGTDRPLTVSILHFPMGTAELEQQIGEDGNQHPIITRAFHNKLFFYGRFFVSNYFAHFDGNFLFVDTGLPARYRVPWAGNLYLIDLPFLILGFSILLVMGLQKKKYLYLLPIIWLAAGAVPAGLTWEDIPNIQRSSFMIYAFTGITAFGMFEALKMVHKRLRLVVSIVVVLLLAHNVFYFFHNYFYHMRIHEPWHRSAAVKEVVFTVKGLEEEYDEVVMTTEGNNNLIHHLFYLQFDPVEYGNLGYPREKDGLRIGKVLYTGNRCPLSERPGVYKRPEGNIVYVNTPSCTLPMNAEILKVIRHPDGVPAYEVVRLNSVAEELYND